MLWQREMVDDGEGSAWFFRILIGRADVHWRTKKGEKSSILHINVIQCDRLTNHSFASRRVGLCKSNVESRPSFSRICGAGRSWNGGMLKVTEDPAVP